MNDDGRGYAIEGLQGRGVPERRLFPAPERAQAQTTQV